jgi:hypothetical protein
MMRAKNCEEEARILGAIRARRDSDPEVQAHLATCESCRDAVSVSRWMQTMSETTGENKELPDQSLLWWKAQMLRRWEAERHVAAPIDRMQRFEVVAGLFGVIAVIVWQWADLRRAFSSLNPETITNWTTTAHSTPYLPVALVGTVLLGIMVVAGIRRLVASS